MADGPTLRSNATNVLSHLEPEPEIAGPHVDHTKLTMFSKDLCCHCCCEIKHQTRVPSEATEIVRDGRRENSSSVSGAGAGLVSRLGRY